MEPGKKIAVLAKLLQQHRTAFGISAQGRTLTIVGENVLAPNNETDSIMFHTTGTVALLIERSGKALFYALEQSPDEVDITTKRAELLAEAVRLSDALHPSQQIQIQVPTCEQATNLVFSALKAPAHDQRHWTCLETLFDLALAQHKSPEDLLCVWEARVSRPEAFDGPVVPLVPAEVLFFYEAARRGFLPSFPAQMSQNGLLFHDLGAASVLDGPLLVLVKDPSHYSLLAVQSEAAFQVDSREGGKDSTAGSVYRNLQVVNEVPDSFETKTGCSQQAQSLGGFYAATFALLLEREAEWKTAADMARICRVEESMLLAMRAECSRLLGSLPQCVNLVVRPGLLARIQQREQENQALRSEIRMLGNQAAALRQRLASAEDSVARLKLEVRVHDEVLTRLQVDNDRLGGVSAVSLQALSEVKGVGRSRALVVLPSIGSQLACTEPIGTSWWKGDFEAREIPLPYKIPEYLLENHQGSKVVLAATIKVRLYHDGPIFNLLDIHVADLRYEKHLDRCTLTLSIFLISPLLGVEK
jgi:hypothetical protein